MLKVCEEQACHFKGAQLELSPCFSTNGIHPKGLAGALSHAPADRLRVVQETQQCCNLTLAHRNSHKRWPRFCRSLGTLPTSDYFLCFSKLAWNFNSIFFSCLNWIECVSHFPIKFTSVFVQTCAPKQSQCSIYEHESKWWICRWDTGPQAEPVRVGGPPRQGVFMLMTTSAFLTSTTTFLVYIKEWSGPLFDAHQLGVRLNFDVDVKIPLSLTSTASMWKPLQASHFRGTIWNLLLWWIGFRFVHFIHPFSHLPVKSKPKLNPAQKTHWVNPNRNFFGFALWKGMKHHHTEHSNWQHAKLPKRVQAIFKSSAFCFSQKQIARNE